MDTHYQTIYKQAAAMQHTFHDYTHQTAYDPNAALIRKEMHGLTNDIAAGKSARTIDNRMKTIQTQIQRTQILNPTVAPGGQNHAPILNYSQRNFLNKNFQVMRQSIQQHPHF